MTLESSAPTTSAKPLQGIKVIELARILAGPFAGQTLADLGATVIKVESVNGDDTRTWGPPFITNPDGSRDAAYFHSCNRGKISVTADLRSSEGQAYVKQLVQDADVVIENFKLGGLKKYGLDYDSLKALNPRLIYASITGFGQTGPYAPRAGYDFIIQGMSGIMSLTGDPDGAPQKIGMAYADIMTGLYTVIGVQAALIERQKTGLGANVDLSLLDCMTATLGNQAMNYFTSGKSPTRYGNSHPNISPYDVYETADSWIILAVGNDSQFSHFCSAVGLDGIASDPRFITNEARLSHRADLNAIIGGVIKGWQRDDLLALLATKGVPAGPINSVAEALEDPQIKARGLVIDQMREDGLSVKGLATPIRFNGGPAQQADSPSPKLGKPLGN